MWVVLAAYTYDVVDNMAGSAYANGVGHQYEYSALNRLERLTVGQDSTIGDPPSIDNIQQQYTYTLN